MRLLFVIVFIFSHNILTAGNMDSLKQKLSSLMAGKNFTTAIYYADCSNPQNYLYVNEKEVFHAASTMKSPVMLGIFKLIERGSLTLADTVLVVNSFKSIVDSSEYSLDIGEDSGDNLYSLIGKYVTIERLLYEMITVSGNLATNILIQIAGAESVMNELRRQGIEGLSVLRGVEDTKAFNAGLNNTVTAEGLGNFYLKLATGTLASSSSVKKMTEILLAQKFGTMIPKYLPASVKVAHKTGSITGIMHDSGIIFLPDGRSYVLVVLNKGFTNPPEAVELTALISKAVYDFAVGRRK